jgi:hypothetical protein
MFLGRLFGMSILPNFERENEQKQQNFDIF